MSTATEERVIRVVLDTNVLISAIIFGGKPRQILELVYSRKIRAVTSRFLLSELFGVLAGRFSLADSELDLIRKEISRFFERVEPRIIIDVLEDVPDNRVLEAAVAGECNLIITGDKDLLGLKKYKKIKILTPAEFLETIEE